MCVLSVPFVEYRSIFIIITLIIMINLGYFVRFVDSSLGGRLSPLLFDGDWWLRWTGLMSAIFALYWVAASALGVQNDMFEYELNERCDELICLDGRFLVDNINAGYIVYSDEFLILVSDSGSEFVREPLVLNPRQTLSCSIFNICIFSEGDALDAAVQ